MNFLAAKNDKNGKRKNNFGGSSKQESRGEILERTRYQNQKKLHNNENHTQKQKNQTNRQQRQHRQEEAQKKKAIKVILDCYRFVLLFWICESVPPNLNHKQLFLGNTN